MCSSQRIYIQASDLMVSMHVITACTDFINTFELLICKCCWNSCWKGTVSVCRQTTDKPCLLCHLCYLVLSRIQIDYFCILEIFWSKGCLGTSMHSFSVLVTIWKQRRLVIIIQLYHYHYTYHYIILQL